MPMLTGKKTAAVLSAAVLLFGTPLKAQSVLEMNIEDLMGVVVTSVSKKSQSLAQTAAAVYVINSEDIKRSGATTIPGALSLAPGVQVSALGNSKWAVSIRGQADRFSNKLLVMVDGRTIYTPLFSGVVWEALGLPLENIDRIEVIRGPGASIWGANAVNGVINIITKSAFDSLGKNVALTAGSEVNGVISARYGWQRDENTAIEIYARAHSYDTGVFTNGESAHDDWRNQSLGFKLNHLLPEGTFMMQGALTRSRSGEQAILFGLDPYPRVETRNQDQILDSGNLLLRWEDKISQNLEQNVQTFFEYSRHEIPVLAERRHTFDVEYQLLWDAGKRQTIILGAGYRNTSDKMENTPTVTLADVNVSSDLFSLFIQDEISLVQDKLALSVGTRVERNYLTGEEFQPNARLLWTPSALHSIWLSYSEAVRTPSRAESGGSIIIDISPPTPSSFGMPVVVKPTGGLTAPEKLNALEVGWRTQFSAKASLDISVFENRYRALRSSGIPEITVVAPPGYLLLAPPFKNELQAEVYGWEAALDWRPLTGLRFQANYSELKSRDSGINAENQLGGFLDSAPADQFSLRSSIDIDENWQLDLWLRRVNNINAYQIPAYNTLDIHVGWAPISSLNFALVGQNLLQDSHLEFESRFIRNTPVAVERGLYLKIDWNF